MTRARSHLVVLAVFTALTVAMTWPMAAHLSDEVHDQGDPLLNSWILAWDVHQLESGNLRGFFDANIFYPNRRTLAYSEHLFPQALAAAPVLLATSNPVLAHNVVMLLSFLASAFAMYLYARYLTGRVAAGVIAGIVYGFSPFMFDHLAHVQIMAAAGFPLVFLFLARFFEEERWRDLALAGLFAALQMLANGYYAVYLALVLPLIIGYHVIAAGKLRQPRFLVKLAVLTVEVAVLAGPFLAQYVAMQRETGFERTAGTEAVPSDYLGTRDINRLYHGVFPGHHEARLFPGFVGSALAGLGVATLLRRRNRPSWHTAPPTRREARLSTRLAAGVAVTGGVAAVLLWGRLDPSAGVVARVLIVTTALIGLRAIVDERFRRRWLRPLTEPRRWAFAHVALLVVAVLASFGDVPYGPYRFLYDHFPGFDGLRAVARIHILTLFSLAALAAFGARALLEERRRWVRLTAVSVLPLLALAELVSVPVPLVKVPVGDGLPAVYHWLAAEGGDAPIVELPIRRSRNGEWDKKTENLRVYASTLHRRPLVNGRSGFAPPSYVELRRRLEKLRPSRAIEEIRALGVREIVLHSDRPRGFKLQGFRHALAAASPPARLVYRDGAAEVWVLAAPLHPQPLPAPPGTTLPRSGWRLTADVDPEGIGAIIDGDLATAWSAERGGVGAWLTVDLGAPRSLHGVELDLGDRPRDFPRRLLVEVSDQPLHWQVAARAVQHELPITSFLEPRRLPLVIPLAGTSARYLRLTCIVGSREGRWSVAELRIW